MFGSGFFIDNTTILTCSHIVVNESRLTDESYLNSRQEPKVVLHDGTELDGTLVQYDSLQDVAMVRVDTSGLPDGSYSPVKLGFPNRVLQGDWIGCFGAPLELPNTITFGVVSAIRTGEELDMGERKGQFFQMDCTTCEVKGLGFAKAYFKKVDPDFNNKDFRGKNFPAYATLARLTWEGYRKAGLRPLCYTFSHESDDN